MERSLAYAAPRQSNDDKIVLWLLCAIVLAVVVGFGGWLVGNTKNPSWEDVTQAQEFARAQGQIDGQTAAYKQGRKNGLRQAPLYSKYQTTQGVQKSYSNGFKAGQTAGRNARSAATTGLGYKSSVNNYGSAYSPYADTAGYDPYTAYGNTSQPYYGYADESPYLPMTGSGYTPVSATYDEPDSFALNY